MNNTDTYVKMNRVFDISWIVVITYFLDIVTTISSTGIKYTLYSVQTTWNEARNICQTHDQTMLKLHTASKYNNFLAVKSQWEDSDQLFSDMWTGLHLTDPSVPDFKWLDCQSIGEGENFWAVDEPDKLDTQLCVRMSLDNALRTRDCNLTFQIVCEEITDKCTFDKFSNKAVVGLNLYSTLNVRSDECKQACLEYSIGSEECVVIVVTDSECRMYIGSANNGQSQPNMTAEDGSDLFVKRCIQGEYKSLSPPVQENTAIKPITICPPSTSSNATSSTDEKMEIKTPLSAVKSSETSYLLSEQSSLSSDVKSPLSHGPVTLSDMSASSEEHITSSNEPEGILISTSLGTAAEASETPSQLMLLSYVSSIQTSFITKSLPSITGTSQSAITTPPLNSISVTAIRESVLESSAPSTTVDNSDGRSVLPAQLTPSEGFPENHKILTTRNDVSLEFTEDYSPSASIMVDNIHLQTSLMYNYTHMTTTLSGNAREPVIICSCFCETKSQLFEDVYNSLKQFVNKGSLSSYKRSKTSARDDRLSAKVIGSSGISVIVVIILLIVCLDLDKIPREFGRRKR